MIKIFARLLMIIYRAGYNLVHNDGLEMAGYLTFLGLLSLFPFIVMIVAGCGLIGQGEMGVKFIAMLTEHAPQEGIAALLPRIREITEGPPPTLLTVSIFSALWTSSSAVEGLRGVLNRAYRVSDPPHFFFRRLVSLIQIIVVTITIIVVMGVLVFAPIALQHFVRATGMEIPPEFQELFFHYFIYVSGGVLFLIVASLYYVLPNVQISFLSVIPGALLVVMLWVTGAGALSFYFENISAVNIIYGSLSSLIFTLLFFYVMNIIFIYGAEFNHALRGTRRMVRRVRAQRHIRRASLAKSKLD